MSLAGKVAVVTGASRGIGKAIAEVFAQEGAVVVGCGISGTYGPDRRAPHFLAERPGVSAEIRQRSLLLRCDVRQAKEVEWLRDEVESRLGPPHILVNNAGTVVREALETMTESDWDEVVNANLKSAFLVTRAFLPRMRQAGRGCLINIASIAGRQGTPLLTAYCAAKHGVIGLTRALAEELRGTGIQVNAICPGSTDTDMLKIGMPGGQPKMSPEEIAHVARFLAVDAPPAMTGACVDVFG